MTPLRAYYLGVLMGAIAMGATGCISSTLIVKVEKRCITSRLGASKCECRDQETGQFVVCPAEWKQR